ncbi:MAG: radical SAM protein [Oscillospiraceae bacterium]|nr:radical SAM protein [Oscillospiraceae bacterium]
MEIVEKEILAKDYLTRSNLPASDYVINPYVGCPHACKYCYARFMKRFTGHAEAWGDFIDIKRCDKPINLKKLKGKSVFLSSVTDCYNQYESKYGITRDILKQLANAECQVTISTKSDLVVRDIDILKKLPHLKVAFSLNTLDEIFRSDMDKGSTVIKRLQAIEQLHEAGIHTVLFMSPIFPYITDWQKIIETTQNIVDEYWFENLNLRGAYKKTILSYIDQWYPDLSGEYSKIYLHKDNTYWEELAKRINEYCEETRLNYVNYFCHEELVKQKGKK